jgi:hypothetical protein
MIDLLWLEILAARWLIRSPRIGMIAIRQRDQPVTWVLLDPEDQLNRQKEEPEPASMLLERLFHEPDALR